MKTPTCNCVYNKSGKCKHIVAVIVFINKKVSLSKTDKEQCWGKPTALQFLKEKYSNGRYFYEMFPEKNIVPKITADAVAVEPNELNQPSTLSRILKEYNKSEEERKKERLKIIARKKKEINLKLSECQSCVENIFNFCDDHELYSAFPQVPQDILQYYE